MNGLARRLRARLPAGSFARSVGILAGGAALGQAITLLASPLLSRLYTPADFGLLAVYSSLLGILTVAANLRYELAIPLPAEDEEAAQVLGISLAVAVAVGLATALAAWAFGDGLVELAGAPGLRPHLWLLPIGVVAVGAYQALSYWAVRKQAYGPIAMTRLAQGASGAAVQLLLGLLRLGPIGLIVGQVVGQAAGSSSLASRVLRLDAPTLSRVRPRAMLAAARRYDRFPKYSTAGALLNSSSLQLPSVLLTAYFGAAVAGWYFFAQRLLRSPLNMVANAVSQVYYGQAPRLARDNPRGLLTLFQRTARRLLLVGAVPLGLLAAVGPWAFATLFGDRWTAAGVYAQLLAPYLLFQFAFGPVSQTFSILEAQRAMLLLNASKMLLSVGPVVAAGRLGLSPETAVLTHSLGLATNYVMAYVVCSRLIRHRIEAHAGSGAGRS